MGPLLRTLACFLAFAAGVPAQDDPREATWRAPQKRGEEEASWHAHLPTGFRADRSTPLVVWFGEEHPEAIQQLTQRGFVVVATTSTQWSVLFAALPRHCHSEQGGFHAVVRGPLDAMMLYLNLLHLGFTGNPEYTRKVLKEEPRLFVWKAGLWRRSVKCECKYVLYGRGIPGHVATKRRSLGRLGGKEWPCGCAGVW